MPIGQLRDMINLHMAREGYADICRSRDDEEGFIPTDVR